MDTHYTRVLPRDLFNEAKLLKCVGRLCLLIHDGLTPAGIFFEMQDLQPFKIGLIPDGHLTVTNLKFYIHGKFVMFKTTYNSKSEYPLLADYEDIEYPVFSNSGSLEPEFIELFNSIKNDTGRTSTKSRTK
jgi:hypothetical protein